MKRANLKKEKEAEKKKGKLDKKDMIVK